MNTITIIMQTPWTYILIPIACYILGFMNGYIVRGLEEKGKGDK